MRKLVSLLGVLFLSALASCSPDGGDPQSNERPEILLFEGTGASPNSVKAWKAILNSKGLRYWAANSHQLDLMTESDFRKYKLLIVPGGNFEEIGNGLQLKTSAAIRNSVRGGTNYLGVCAGAFFAGHSPYNGLNLTDGARFNFHALSREDVRKAVVPISIAGEGTFDHYWEDGPELSGWGTAVAVYSDGTPAVVQGMVGRGFVVLVGIHPEAPQDWRAGMTFDTPVHVTTDYAKRLLDAALNGATLAQTKPSPASE